MSEKPPETPPERPTTAVVEPAPEAEQPAPKSEPAASKAEPERMPPPLPPRALRPASAPSFRAQVSTPAPTPPSPSQPASTPAAATDAAKAWRILSHAATIRGWAIVWLVATAFTVFIRESMFVVNRYLYLDLSRLRFLFDLLPLTLLLLVIGAVVMRRAARSISIEFAPGERGAESDAARTASTWAMLVLAVAVFAMAIRYVTEYSVLSGNIDIFYFDLQYRLEQWLHRVIGIFVVVASILLLQRMGPLAARQRGLIGNARPAYVPVAATYAPR